MRHTRIQYYTTNIKILPPPDSTGKRYVSLLDGWFNKGYRITLGNDTNHYFSLTRLDKIGNGESYYGVVSKFVTMESIDFIDKNTGSLVEFSIPSNLEARVNEYEFVFIPKCHRFAFIKGGKINPEVSRRGAPLKQMTTIIEKAFKNIAAEHEDVKVIVQQSDQVFKRIFEEKILSLDIKVSYTNDDLSNEGKKTIDSLLRDGQIGEFIGKFRPDSSGFIKSDALFPKEMIKLAKENGQVKAKMKNEEGDVTNLNTKEHPEINELEVEDDGSREQSFINKLYSTFIERYRSQ